jgi:hypothetical protein
MPASQVIDRYGRPIEDTDIVPDGGRVSVPCLFMDALSEQTRRALGRSALGLHDGMGHPAGHKPGFVFGTDRSCYLNAREQHIRELQDAWRPKPTDAAGSSVTDAEVDAYTEYKQHITNAWRTAR